MSTIDVEPFKTRLLDERERTLKAISYLHEENRGTTEDEQREL
jgi:DnaK suppressor protein